MIIIKDISESFLEKEIPGTLNALRGISRHLETLGFDIEIRDTEDFFDSLSIYPVARNKFDSQKYSIAASTLHETIYKTCCKCGKNKDVKQYPSDIKYDWSFCHIFCPDCYHKSLPFIPPLLPRMLKDSTGKGVHEGDIIMGITNDGKIFWGLIIAKQSTLSECYSKQTWGKDDFILLHNPHSFPSHLSCADKFIIIANCGTTHNPYDNYDPHYIKYYKWLKKINKSNKW